MDHKDLLGQWLHYATYDTDMTMISQYRSDRTGRSPEIWHFVRQGELIISHQNGTQSAVRYAFNPTSLTLVLVYQKQFLTVDSQAPYNEHYTAHLINCDTLLLYCDEIVLHFKRC